jgi:FHA domain
MRFSWTLVPGTQKWWRLVPLLNRETPAFGIAVTTAYDLSFNPPDGAQWEIVVENGWRIFLTDICSPEGTWLNGERIAQGVRQEIILFEDDVWLCGPRALWLSLIPRTAPEGVIVRIGIDLFSPEACFQAKAYEEVLRFRSVDAHPASGLVRARDELREHLEREMRASLGGRAPTDADWEQARERLRQQFLSED